MKITFDNKVNTKQSTTPKINRVDADDMNEIKTVVNTNANINEWSTTEQKIGKFNGEDLYRKILIYNYGDLTTSGSSNITFNINLSDICENIDDWWLDFNKSSIKVDSFKAFLTSSSSGNFKYTATTGSVLMFSTNSTYYKTGSVVTIVIEYTKN